MNPGSGMGSCLEPTIEAQDYHIEQGCAYVFMVGTKVICSYPVMFTIIEEIKNK
jgi:uncharacterized membrane protein YadS